jgi:hypothetical protein
MAIGNRHSRQAGWQDQANRLVRKHTAIPGLSQRAPVSSAAGRQKPETHPVSAAKDSNQRSGQCPPDERRDQVVDNDFDRQEALDWILKTRKTVLVARAERAQAAQQRMADLEARLEIALARTDFLENENQSLQTSLDLTVGENLDLARRLAESESRSDEVRSELQSSEMTRAEYDLAAAAAERKIELLQNLIAVKEARLQRMGQARKKMQQDIKKLLATTKARDEALAEAERRVFALTELFEKLELSLDAGKTETASRDIRPATNPPPSLKESVAVKKTGRQPQLWQRALDTDDWLLDGPAARN